MITSVTAVLANSFASRLLRGEPVAVGFHAINSHHHAANPRHGI